MGLALLSKHKMLSLMLMQILTLMLLLILHLILVDFKVHVNINISHDANLGARSSLFCPNTAANRSCDADINKSTSIYTSMDASSADAVQLRKIQL